MTGVVFATLREAKPFLQLVSADKITDEPFPLWSFGPSEMRLIVLLAGIGLEAAGKAMDHLFRNYAVSEIVNAGICGALTDDAAHGDIFKITSVCDAGTPYESIDSVSARCEALPSAKLATSLEPVFDGELRKILSAHAELVDMEGVAIARACRMKSVPWCMVKVVSDSATDGGRSTMLKNFDAVSTKLANILHESFSD